MKKIRYGIIGYGLFAENTIAPSIRETDNSELVAIQKRSLTEAREHAGRLGIRHAFSTAEDLVRCDEVDTVFIASANVTHCSETLAAAAARKHVLVEKPMAMNVDECRRMTEACNSNGVKLMVGQIVRFSPAVREIRDLVQSNALGRIICVSAEFEINTGTSRRTWFYDRVVAGGGPIFDLGVHCLDTLYYILGDHVQEVKSQCSPLPTATTTERSAVLALAFSRGTVGSITCSFEAHAYRAHLGIVGTEGSVSLERFNLSNHEARLVIDKTPHRGSASPELRMIKVPNLCAVEISAFSRSILEGFESPVPGTVGIHHQAVLDSAMAGGAVLEAKKPT